LTEVVLLGNVTLRPELREELTIRKLPEWMPYAGAARREGGAIS
jgi:hypothetical protein